MSTSIDSCRTASKRSGLSPAVAKSRDTWEFECDKGIERLHCSVKALIPEERRVETPEVSRGFASWPVSISLYSITSLDPRFNLTLAHQVLPYFGGEARRVASLSFLNLRVTGLAFRKATKACRALYGKPTRNSEIIERFEISAVAYLLASQLTEEANR